MTIRKLLNRMLFIVLLSSTSYAQAITVSFIPDSLYVSTGSVANVDIVISGLGSGSSPSLGVFDLNVIFDPNILNFNSITFGNQLDLFGLGSIQGYDGSVMGIVNIFELSLDFPADLDALQDDSFTLATLSFDILAEGTSILDIANLFLGDSYGDSLTATVMKGSVTGVAAVYEPGSIFILMAGLFGLLVFDRIPQELSLLRSKSYGR